MPVATEQHAASADMVWAANNALLLHTFDYASSGIVADTELTLEP